VFFYGVVGIVQNTDDAGHVVRVEFLIGRHGLRGEREDKCGGSGDTNQDAVLGHGRSSRGMADSSVGTYCRNIYTMELGGAKEIVGGLVG
jgi:hypothetical protein